MRALEGGGEGGSVLAPGGKVTRYDRRTGEDIGAAVVYLASKEAGYVTGQTLHVNGGMAMI